MSERIAYQHNRDHILKFAGMEKLTGEQVADELNRLHTIIAEQNEEIAALERENAELERVRKDAERIEWLEEQTKKSYTGISFDYHRHVEDGYVVDHGYRFMRRHFASGFKDSLRKAIDAAMEEGHE